MKWWRDHYLNRKLKTKGNQRVTDFCEIKICQEEDIKVQALKALQWLRELTIISGDALEHVGCAVHNLGKPSVVDVQQCWTMMMMMMMVEMKRVLRVLTTMMKFRTCPHKDSCNVFSSIKFVQFNNFHQQMFNWWHVFQVVYAVSIKERLRTTDCGLGIKYGLGIKCGLENTDWV